MQAFQFVAILTATLFSGAAIYVNLVEHPARMECGTELAASVFGPSYRRAAKMQAILATAATIAGIGSWFMDARVAWLVGALLIFAVVPFTIIAIRPTNNRLLDPALKRTPEAARRLLQRSGRLHAIRSILALAASAVFLSLVLSSSPKP
jgi:anthrone oxygenase-like protein